MKKLFQFYRLLNILSIDVAIGAVVCALFFAKVLNVSILPYGLIALGLTVWIVYTADHLLDARKVQQPASTKRHRFHQQNFKTLFGILIIVITLDAAQLVFIRKIVFIEGLGLAFLILIYFLFHRHLRFFKEAIGAVLYSCGVLLIPWSVKMNGVNNSQILLIGQFAITALINLLLFSWFDLQQDVTDKRSSFATVMGEDASRYSLYILFFAQIIITLAQFVVGELTIFQPTANLILMNTLLFTIFSNKKYFEKEDRYRLLGDAVFLVPLIYVLS